MEEANITSLQETEWIDMARKGDLDAFNQLVLRYQDAAFRLAQWMLNDDASAEDIVQNVFLVVYRGISSFRCGSFRAWLLKIARNACIDELRQRKRHPWLALEAQTADGEEVETSIWLIDPQLQPEEALVRREAWHQVEQYLRRLPEQMREVVILVDVEGLDYAEAATALGIPLGTVKSRLGRARAYLREIMRAEPDGAGMRANHCASSQRGKLVPVVRDHPAEGNRQFDSGTLKPGDSFSFTFSKTGIYAYDCSTDETTTGMVTVQP